MAELFTLTFSYLNNEKEYNAELQVYGYSYKIAVTIGDTVVFFEPDEERNFRAVFAEPDTKMDIDKGLLQAIAMQLEEAFK